MILVVDLNWTADHFQSRYQRESNSEYDLACSIASTWSDGHTLILGHLDLVLCNKGSKQTAIYKEIINKKLSKLLIYLR